MDGVVPSCMYLWLQTAQFVNALAPVHRKQLPIVAHREEAGQRTPVRGLRTGGSGPLCVIPFREQVNIQ